jgi:hypothetical protein
MSYKNERDFYSEVDIAAPAIESRDYIPQWTGTGLAYGDTPATGKYYRIGSLVYVQLRINMTYVTNFGTGAWSVTLPIPATHHEDVYGGSVHDISSGHIYSIKGHVNENSDVMSLWYVDSAVRDEPVLHNKPINFTTEDFLHIAGWYEGYVN